MVIGVLVLGLLNDGLGPVNFSILFLGGVLIGLGFVGGVLVGLEGFGGIGDVGDGLEGFIGLCGGLGSCDGCVDVSALGVVLVSELVVLSPRILVSGSFFGVGFIIGDFFCGIEGDLLDAATIKGDSLTRGLSTGFVDGGLLGSFSVGSPEDEMVVL